MIFGEGWDEPPLDPGSGRMSRLVDRVRIPVADVVRNLSPKAIDGEVVHTETITGAVVRKWLGAVERTQGTYTGTFPVSSGTHEVGIRLQAPGYDRTRSLQGEFIRGKESILSVDSGRGLSLAWRLPEHAGIVAEAPAASPGWMKHAGAILLTIFGSILSASVGVAVQEFLRSRAARGTIPPPSRPPS